MLGLLQAKEIFDAAVKAPVASLLIVVGVLFLALCVVGNNRYVKPGKQGRVLSGIIGAVLVLIGVGIHMRSSAPTTQPAAEFVKTRPSTSAAPQALSDYELKGPAVSPTANFSQLGVTVWKLRPAAATDDRRLLFQEVDNTGQPGAAGANDNSIPSRVEADATFEVGDRVFLTVECPRAGFLYVIDREQYADGTTSEPYLVYPNVRAHDNAASPGRLIRIPWANDNPNFFSMKPLRTGSPKQAAEILSIIVTAQQISNLTPASGPLRLSGEQAAGLEGSSTIQTERYEMRNGAGKAWTSPEKSSSSDDRRILTQEDPLPQTIYRLSTSPDAPLVVRVSLHYRER